jgi:hypothetical protein
MGVQIPKFPEPFQVIHKNIHKRTCTLRQAPVSCAVNTVSGIRAAKIQFDFEKCACESDFEQDFFPRAANFPQIPLFLHIFAYGVHVFFYAPSP